MNLALSSETHLFFGDGAYCILEKSSSYIYILNYAMYGDKQTKQNSPKQKKGINLIK